MENQMDKLHYEDLTKITCPFGLLDSDTQDRLKTCWEIEWFDDGDWRKVNTRTYGFGSYMTYREKPKPFNPPWEYIAGFINYIAMNESGYWYGFNEKPARGNVVWEFGYNTGLSMECLDFSGFKGDWKDSLHERPKG